MKNYTDSDFALNKYSKGIVYHFADGIVEITLEAYIRENPGKTEKDFHELKALSDTIYSEQDSENYRQTWKNTPISSVGDVDLGVAASPEESVVEEASQAERQNKRREAARLALSTLTDVQRRRYLLYHVHGLTLRQIAEAEGVIHTKIHRSLIAAERKIKKFFTDRKK